MKTKLKTDSLEFLVSDIEKPFNGKQVRAYAGWNAYTLVDTSVWETGEGIELAKKSLRAKFIEFMYGDIRADLIDAIEMYNKGYEFDAMDTIAELISVLGGATE
jgi:hypothetical protein